MGRAVERAQSLGEEIANGVGHGLGLLAALAAFPVLVAVAARGSAAQVVGASVFATSAVLLYLSSTLFHAVTAPRAKRVFQILDHSAIYLLIAGTYTPFTLGVLRGPWGWTLFGLVWGFAAVGTIVKAIGGVRYNGLSTAVYLAMGWLIIIAADPAWPALVAAVTASRRAWSVIPIVGLRLIVPRGDSRVPVMIGGRRGSPAGGVVPQDILARTARRR